MLLKALLLLIGTGIIWSALGILCSACSKNNVYYPAVQGLGGLGGILLCGTVLAFTPVPEIDTKYLIIVALANTLAGIANYHTFIITGMAMKIGPNGLVWGIMQAGTIGSFLMGVFFFGEQATPFRVCGLFLIIAGIFAMGADKKNANGTQGKKWLWLSLIAFLLVILTHCCSALPSFIPETCGVSSVFRTLFIGVGTLTAFTYSSLKTALKEGAFRGSKIWEYSGILVLLNCLPNFFMFYYALDCLSQIGCASIGYPVTIGTTVAGFSLYSILVLHEKIRGVCLIGLLATIVGVIAISL